MIDNRESDFIFIKWLFFIVGLIIFIIIFYKFGFITDLIKNDVSFISPLIILIFIFFTIHVGYILYNLKTTYKNCLLFKDECSLSKKENKSHINNFKSSNNYFLTSIYQHFMNLSQSMNKNDTHKNSSKKELSAIFEYKFTKILETGWFVSDFL